MGGLFWALRPHYPAQDMHLITYILSALPPVPRICGFRRYLVWLRACFFL